MMVTPLIWAVKGGGGVHVTRTEDAVAMVNNGIRVLMPSLDDALAVLARLGVGPEEIERLKAAALSQPG